MSRELIGKANHVYPDRSVSTLEVHTIETERDIFITIGDADDQESIIINSQEQWQQLDALINTAFDGKD